MAIIKFPFNVDEFFAKSVKYKNVPRNDFEKFRIHAKSYNVL